MYWATLSDGGTVLEDNSLSHRVPLHHGRYSEYIHPGPTSPLLRVGGHHLTDTWWASLGSMESNPLQKRNERNLYLITQQICSKRDKENLHTISCQLCWVLKVWKYVNYGVQYDKNPIVLPPQVGQQSPCLITGLWQCGTGHVIRAHISWPS